MEGTIGELVDQQFGSPREKGSERHHRSYQNIQSLAAPLLQELLLELSHLPVNPEKLPSALFLCVDIVQVAKGFMLLQHFRNARHSFAPNSVKVLGLRGGDVAFHPLCEGSEEASLVNEGIEEVAKVVESGEFKLYHLVVFCLEHLQGLLYGVPDPRGYPHLLVFVQIAYSQLLPLARLEP